MCSKLVIDTNVFVSALISADGVSRAVLRACLQGKYQPLMGTALFLEYESILARSDVMVRCPLPKADVEALLAALMSVSQWVQIYYLWRPNLRDEADNHLIELAIRRQCRGNCHPECKRFPAARTHLSPAFYSFP